MFGYFIYHDSGKCPFCGSVKTGYYISAGASVHPEDIKARYLKHGEYVKILYGGSTEQRLFCLSCENEWNGSLKLRIIKREEFDSIKEEKEITDDMPNIVSMQGIEPENDQIKKKHKINISPYIKDICSMTVKSSVGSLISAVKESIFLTLPFLEKDNNITQGSGENVPDGIDPEAWHYIVDKYGADGKKKVKEDISVKEKEP